MHDLVIRNGTIVDGTGTPAFVGDIAIDAGRIAAVGTVTAKGREEIDAAGLHVTPGFVDIHTHYDGQATWDSEMAPSSWHGVTTVVMGNCGVGFAPARPDRHDWLIGLMEGVEDIPGTALAEGMAWNWETFPEYMDALAQRPRTIDVATHVAHGAVRAYVMGERGANNEAPTEHEIAQMSAIVEEGLKSGALGFSTSRTVLHKSIDGVLVPGTTATKEELIGIGRAVARAGHGVFEMASDLRREWDEFGWMGALSKETGLPVTFAMLQSIAKELPWQEQMSETARWNAEGANIVAQIALRGNGILMAWRGTVHPFKFKPSWAEIDTAPWDVQWAKISDPAWKAQLLAEADVIPESDVTALLYAVAQGFGLHYEMDADFDYEPTQAQTIAARAAAAGVSPAEYAYDLMSAKDGTGFIYFPILNYADGNLDFVEGLLQRDDIVISLSDGGAHCGTICDAASPTYLLQHWVRDRKRGTITIENAIKRQCSDTARLYGMHDRGQLVPGLIADINLIDMARLKLGAPWMAFDLPAGGKRLLQRADGYVATIKSGVVTFREGQMTGDLPGVLIRGPQAAPPVALAAE
ncbi:N-acyl-D-amino-acid deacylase family protein [Polymorphobacter fuscus]|uniref:Amidohydrolase family protein n=1 Tax=Sandarakinorhabdus fusca TaxID=1439888 RepID=A0A7C9KYB0_9SPHN|nr:D-aminoacylase [Polymorphobacter fuscus]KAB7644955.1 D-aminoacylase [Polymorphobacter fuscus]MQT18242.1 amidohydrolase family protein [Polymorphobacter fuscus]NJC09566.1 N-acyl-D-aspartate/D-glutamate deacylase [Polymorphobacter fuscus]